MLQKYRSIVKYRRLNKMYAPKNNSQLTSGGGDWPPADVPGKSNVIVIDICRLQFFGDNN